MKPTTIPTEPKGFCRQQGYDARLNGAEIEDCPYPASTLEASRWRAGWRDKDFELDGDTIRMKQSGIVFSEPVQREYGRGKTTRVVISVTAEERDRIADAARAAGKTVASYARGKVIA